MNSPLVIGIGAALGLLRAAGTYFDRRVPGRPLIVLAGLLHAAYILPTSALTGALSDILIARRAF